MPAPSPLNVKSDLTSFSILINGAPISESYLVTGIEVLHAVNKVPKATLELADGSAPDGDFSISDGEEFVPGSSIQIELGYENLNRAVFRGTITQQRLRSGMSGGSSLVVECAGKAINMTIGRKTAIFSKLSDSAVLSNLVEQSGLKASIAKTEQVFEEIVQYGSTDWDFVVMRAEYNGLVVIAEDGALKFEKPDPSQAAVLTVTYGVDIFDFSFDADATTQLADVKAMAWDMETQSIINAEAKVSNLNALGNFTSEALAKVAGPEPYEIGSTGPLTKKELQTWATGEMTRAMMAKIRGRLTFPGSSLVKPGAVIEIAGVGQRFSGKAYVGGVRHYIENAAWRTEVEIGLAPERFSSRLDIDATPASGLLPAVSGLQNAVVKQIHQDPAGQFRVLVQIPIMINNENQTLWARFAQPYATNQAGLFFFPEIGDEVVLGFLNADPRFPIILGSLYSSEKKVAPFTPDEDNTNKAIVTKSKLKIVFDDIKKVITIYTPAKNSVVLSDQGQSISVKDQSSNEITLSPTGILIKGSKVKIEAQQGVEITTVAGDIIASASAGKINNSAMNIALSAQMELSASAQAMASLEANGETTIRGGLVRIN
jgi:Rhs element Vgr protein